MVDVGLVLPPDVGFFLNFLGIPWVNVDEDAVRQVAGHVRTFVSDMETTVGAASEQIRAMGTSYAGHSYQQLVASWAQMEGTHMAALGVGGHVLADGMDVAADVIFASKAVVIAELGALATTAVAALAMPGGVALEPVLAAAARKVTDALAKTLEQHVLGDILDKAITQFEDVIDQVVSGIKGLTYRTVSSVLAVDKSPTMLRLNPDEVLSRAKALMAYGDEFVRHHTRFADNLASVNIVRIDPPLDGGDWATLPGAADAIMTMVPYGDGADPRQATGPARQAAEPVEASEAPQPEGRPLIGKTVDGGSFVVESRADRSPNQSALQPDSGWFADVSGAGESTDVDAAPDISDRSGQQILDPGRTDAAPQRPPADDRVGTQSTSPDGADAVVGGQFVKQDVAHDGQQAALSDSVSEPTIAPSGGAMMPVTAEGRPGSRRAASRLRTPWSTVTKLAAPNNAGAKPEDKPEHEQDRGTAVEQQKSVFAPTERNPVPAVVPAVEQANTSHRPGPQDVTDKGASQTDTANRKSAE